MDKLEQMHALSREEYIRLARESCKKNLSYNGGNLKNHGINKSKGNIKTEKPKTWDQTDMKTRLNLSSVNLKPLLIRIICAFVLFLAVFLIDKFDVKINSFNSKYIQDLVSSKQSIEDAENFFVSLFEEFAKSEE